MTITVAVPGTITRVKKVVVGTPVRRLNESEGAISDSTDVDASNLQNGSVLVYSTSSSKWVATKDLENQNVDGGSF